jgi:hypothetical protein
MAEEISPELAGLEAELANLQPLADSMGRRVSDLSAGEAGLAVEAGQDLLRAAYAGDAAELHRLSYKCARLGPAAAAEAFRLLARLAANQARRIAGEEER